MKLHKLLTSGIYATILFAGVLLFAGQAYAYNITTLYFTSCYDYTASPISSAPVASSGGSSYTVNLCTRVGANGGFNPILHLKFLNCPAGATCDFYQNFPKNQSDVGYSITSSDYGARYTITTSVRNLPPGNSTITVQASVCDNGYVDGGCIGGTETGTRTINIPVTVTAAAPTVSLSASPNSGTAPFNSNLTWSTTNSPTSCTASGGWSGSKSVSGGTETISNITNSNAYTITCTNGAGSATASASITASQPAAPAVTLTASPTTGASPLSTTLSWSSTNNPTSCTATGGTFAGSKSSSGTQTISGLTSATTFTLRCSNAGGNSNTASVTVTPTTTSVPTVSLTATPTSGTAPLTITLNWSTTNNPTSCTASGSWSGAKAVAGGSQTISNLPAGTYSYSLTCSNAAGTSASAGSVASVTVNNPNGAPNGGGGAGTGPTVTGPTTGYTNNTYTFTATASDPQGDQIRYGFDWNMDGTADTWVPAGVGYVNSGVSQSATHSWPTTGAHTFQVLAQDAPGANSPWTSHTITLSNQVLTPTVTLSASPSSMTLPTNTTRLAWSTTNNPTSCTASGSWSGAKAVAGGFQDISGIGAGTYNYSITCSNSSGSATSNASVVVNAAIPTYSLNVTNTYGGSVRSVDGFINCGSTCSRVYNQGNTVTLNAYPMSAQWQFVGWTGACAGTGACTVTMNSAKSVTALFALHPLNYNEF